jgi:uncharacterized membrane protein
MHAKQIIGIILFVLGVALIAISYHTKQTTTDKIKNLFGNEKKNKHRELIGGVILVVVGAGVFVLGKNKKGKKQ